jgi:hypothetical protein
MAHRPATTKAQTSNGRTNPRRGPRNCRPSLRSRSRMRLIGDRGNGPAHTTTPPGRAPSTEYRAGATQRASFPDHTGLEGGSFVCLLRARISRCVRLSNRACVHAGCSGDPDPAEPVIRSLGDRGANTGPFQADRNTNGYWIPGNARDALLAIFLRGRMDAVIEALRTALA